MEPRRKYYHVVNGDDDVGNVYKVKVVLQLNYLPFIMKTVMMMMVVITMLMKKKGVRRKARIINRKVSLGRCLE